MSRRARRAARGLAGRPRRPLARDRARRDPGPARRVEILAPLTDVDLAALRYYAIAEGQVAGDPGARRPDRLHRRGRLRDLRRHGPRAASCGTRSLAPGGRAGSRRSGSAPATRSASRPGMPLYGNELDRHDEPVRGRPRPRREARQAGRLRRPGGARAGRPRRLREAARRARDHAAAGIARHGYPVSTRGDAADGRRHQRHPSPTLGMPIAMAYVAPGRWRAGYDARRRDPRAARSPPRSCRCRSTSVRATSTREASTRAARRVARSRRSAPDGPRGSALHEGPRVGPRRRRRGDDRDHRLRRRAARRHRLRGAAGGRARRSSSSRRSASSSRSRP